MRYVTCVAILAGFLMAGAARAQHVISSTTGLFTPSFRADGTGAGETYFGWGSGQFDGGTDNELMENPPPSINPTAGAGLNQNNASDLLSGSNNIFYSSSNSATAVDLTLTIPTNGTPGTGFTTIILQGKGLASPQGMLNHVIPGTINGISPVSFLVGVNAFVPTTTQWWAKYELPGNSASYSLNITGGPNAAPTFPVSVAELVVDTSWSASGYAPDTAIVPEPASLGMLLIGGISLLRRRSTVRRSESFGGRENAI